MYLCAVFCNGKEFVEAHGYNVYDYGFREYYAAIGRFMTMDPLAEMTPWKSPYSYAGNNFVNKTDYMGLFEDYPTNPDGSPCYTCGDPSEFVHNNDYEWNQLNKDGSLKREWQEEHGGGVLPDVYYSEYGPNITWRDFFNPLPSWINISENGYNPYDINLSFIMLGEKTLLPGVDVLNYIVVNTDGYVIGGVPDDDNSIYVDLDGKWSPLDGKNDLKYVCPMEHDYDWYMWRAQLAGGSGCFQAVPTKQVSKAIEKALMTDVVSGVADNCLQAMGGKTMGPVGSKVMEYLGGTKTVVDIYKIYENLVNEGYSPEIAYNMAKEALSFGAYKLLEKYGVQVATTISADAIPAITAAAVEYGPYILAGAAIAAVLGGMGYGLAKLVAPPIFEFNSYWGSYETCLSIYENGFK